MPDLGRVSQIDASAFDAASAYVSVRRPLLDRSAALHLRTHDFGKTWTKIVAGIAAVTTSNAIREDAYRKGLLYAGANRGMYISYDDGDHWESLSLNLPEIPVTEHRGEAERPRHLDDGPRLLRPRQHQPLAARRSRGGGQGTPISLRRCLHFDRTRPERRFSTRLAHPAQSIKIEISDTTGRVATRSSVERRPPPVDTRRGTRRARRSWRLRRKRDARDDGWRERRHLDLRYPNAVGFPGMILWGGGLTGPARRRAPTR